MEYVSYSTDSVDLTPESPFFFDHVTRYWWAANYAKDKDILDCACGKGYGSFILSHNAESVTGIDLNERSLEIARNNFKANKLHYKSQDVFKTHEMNSKFSLITAFEVIEHIDPSETDKFLNSLANSLTDKGELLLSTPNHDVSLKSGVHIPEFHINNFRPQELKLKLEEHFEVVEMYGQFQRRSMLNHMVFSMDFFNLRHLLRPKSASAIEGESVEQIAKEIDFGAIKSNFYDQCPKEFGDYIFSRSHWRQAGLTVAVCAKPRLQK